jgi:hypothetical protein
VTLVRPGRRRRPNQEQGVEPAMQAWFPCRHIGHFVLPATMMDTGASMVGEAVTERFPKRPSDAAADE